MKWAWQSLKSKPLRTLSEWVKWVKVAQLCLILWHHGLYSPQNSPGQNTGVGSLFLLQGIFPNPGIEPRSPTLQADSLPAEPQGKPKPSLKYLWRTLYPTNLSQQHLFFVTVLTVSSSWSKNHPLGTQCYPGSLKPTNFHIPQELTGQLIANHPKFEVKKYIAR